VFLNGQADCPSVTFGQAPVFTIEAQIPFNKTWETCADGQTFEVCADGNCGL